MCDDTKDEEDEFDDEAGDLKAVDATMANRPMVGGTEGGKRGGTEGEGDGDGRGREGTEESGEGRG